MIRCELGRNSGGREGHHLGTTGGKKFEGDMSWSGNAVGLGKAIDGVEFGDGHVRFPLHERINKEVRPNWGSTEQDHQSDRRRGLRVE